MSCSHFVNVKRVFPCKVSLFKMYVYFNVNLTMTILLIFGGFSAAKPVQACLF